MLLVKTFVAGFVVQNIVEHLTAINDTCTAE